MPLDASAHRPPAATRRVGYLVAIAVTTAMLIILNAAPGWQAIPFLTSGTSQVLGLVNLSLAAGLAVNLVYLCYDPPSLKSLGDLITSAIGLAVAIRVWQVFPFTFHGSAAWCATALRLLLIFAIGGSAINVLIQAASLGQWMTRHAAHGGHPRTGH
jgi:hypothetical protein